MTKGHAATARAVALVGPCGSGKTQLMEALLFASGAISAPGALGARVGDMAGGDRLMSTETSCAHLTFLGDRFTIFDTPGSVEFEADALHALAASDLAVVVVEPDPAAAPHVQRCLKQLEELGVPAVIFVNKIDQAQVRARDLLAALQAVSAKPLVMRQIPIWAAGSVTGFIDLALERAYIYKPGAASTQIAIPSDLADREADARFQMLERLADFDDALMEQLLEDVAPDRARVFADLTDDLRAGMITPVFLGQAREGGGVRRLLKALRHETPQSGDAARRLFGAPPEASSVFVVKTRYAGQAGKVSMARVFGGDVREGETLKGGQGASARLAGLSAPHAGQQVRVETAAAGEVVLISRFGEARTGDVFVSEGTPPAVRPLKAPAPVYGRAVFATRRSDDVKVSSALGRLAEEDPSLCIVADIETGEMRLDGQGELHVRTALERLAERFHVSLEQRQPATPYRETIRVGTVERGRHKKQSGGHGQFGDVVLQIAPGAPGSGVVLGERISGGVVPRQYFAAVREGAQDALERGPLGFPVVDLSVTLIDGSHHAVDSSEIAFRSAARLAVNAALERCKPVLLEPLWRVVVTAPSDVMARVTNSLTARRGQILGFDSRPGWPGWDALEALTPHGELHDLIIELRSASQGLASFTAAFAHHAPLEGRLAEMARARALEPARATE